MAQIKFLTPLFQWIIINKWSHICPSVLVTYKILPNVSLAWWHYYDATTSERIGLCGKLYFQFYLPIFRTVIHFLFIHPTKVSI